MISYFLGRNSVSFAAVQHLLHNRQLLASDETFSEFREVMLRDKFNRVSVARRLSFISNYRAAVIFIEPHIEIAACVDPKDDKFLSLAVSGTASLILTSDDHLLRLHPFRGIDILSPTTYLAANPR
jgi:putative PIN family toxin of toxin-antitoxin system